MTTKKKTTKPLIIGVLALQGAYEAHARMLAELGAKPKLVRTPAELKNLDGIIIPGGESSTFLWHLEQNGFFDILKHFVETTPTFGTCAGCILLAKEVTNPEQKAFGALDIKVERNAYGRQIDSSILTGRTKLPGGPLEMVFIRAPRIAKVGKGIETLASREGSPVLVRKGHLMAATFHPELSSDTRVHQAFLDLVARHKAGGHKAGKRK
jgi:5'-phosphate synthase pdxT subunit